MPQTTDIDYLDGEFTVQESEPSTIAELTEMIGEAAVVDETTSNLRYRNKYPRVYKAVSKAIEPDFPRDVKETKTLKDGTTREVKISENDHLRAYLLTGDDARARLAELFTSIAQSEPLYVKGERSGGGGKVSQANLDAANGWFAEGVDVVEDKVSIIESMVPGYKVGRDADGAPTPESVARGIAALNKHLLNEQQKKTKALLGGK